MNGLEKTEEKQTDQQKGTHNKTFLKQDIFVLSTNPLNIKQIDQKVIPGQ